MERRLTRDNVANLYGKPLYGRNGDKIGDIDEFLFDTRTGDPEWISVKSGLFGMSSKIAPLSGAETSKDGLMVPYDKDTVKDAPDISMSDGAISEADERALWNHYGSPVGGTMGRTETTRAPEMTRGRGTAVETEGRSVELREEELRARKEDVQAGEVQIRKDVVTENRTIEVPVTREEVYVERHPATGEHRASGEPIGEGESIRVPIHEEQVTVEKRPVVTEEIEVGKRRVTDTERVSGQVRREEAHIERTGDVEVRGERDTERHDNR